MKYLLIFLLVLAIFVVSVTLGAQNDQQVTFNYLLAQGEYRISTLLAVLFAAGFAIGWLICGLFWLHVRVSLARAERKIKRLEQQIAPATTAPATAVPAAPATTAPATHSVPVTTATTPVVKE
ncbi:LapA family protein [Pseudescherichia vulneris]|uniref:LapA family protein n=1 Tax=Pseudescherichia vulneris TaxID=566 RepID=UPI003CC91C91